MIRTFLVWAWTERVFLFSAIGVFFAVAIIARLAVVIVARLLVVRWPRGKSLLRKISEISWKTAGISLSCAAGLLVTLAIGWGLYQILNVIDNDFFEISLLIVCLVCLGFKAGYEFVQRQNIGLSWIVSPLNSLDDSFSKRIAALGISWWRIVGAFIFAYALMAVVPPAAAFILLLLMIIYTVAIHRRWSRTEADWDRFETEPLDRDTEVKLRGAMAELSDEALLASILLLLAFPQCLHQMHVRQPPILSVSGDVRFYDWYWFTFVEFLKEFPQVGWADVFDVHIPTKIKFISPPSFLDMGRIVIFAMRASIDFLVLNALGSLLGVRRAIVAGRRPTELSGERLRRFGENLLKKWTYARLTAVRAKGVEGLGLFTGSPAARGRCLDVLQEARSLKSQRLAAEALRALRNHHRLDPIEQNAIRQMLHESEGEVLIEAIHSAHSYHLPEIDDAVLAALGNQDDAVAVTAVDVATALALPRAETLLVALLDRSQPVRNAAVDALATIGSPASAAPLVALATGLGESDWDGKERIARSLGKIGDATVLPDLKNLKIFGVRRPSGKGNPNPGLELLGAAIAAAEQIKARISP